MINLVKVFTVLVVITSVVIVSVSFCESTKSDFTLKNIFRLFNETKVGKKFKKEVKQVKDYRVTNLSAIEDNHRRDIGIRPPLIHTLIPLPLPVHLPIPGPPEFGDRLIPHSPFSPFLPNLPFPPPIPMIPRPHFHVSPHPPHQPRRPLPSHPKAQPSEQIRTKSPKPRTKNQKEYHHHHDDYHHHYHDNRDHHHHHHPPYPHSRNTLDPLSPMVGQASTIFMNPVPPPMIIHQRYPSEMDIIVPPLPIHEPLPNGIAVPVFELIEADSKSEVHPNAHSYGRETDDTIKTNVNIDSNYKKTNDNENRVTKHRESQRRPEEHKGFRPAKAIETTRTVKLVNNQKFKTIHNINTDKIDKYSDEESHNVRKFEENPNKRGNEFQSSQRRDVSRPTEDKPLDQKSDKKTNQEIPLPDEQIINVTEDEWTFKDLDLWLVR